MELIFSGGWTGKEGLYRTRIGSVYYLDKPSEIRVDRDLFVVLSYDLTSELLGVPVKNSGLPPVIVVETGEPEPVEVKGFPSRCNLEYLSSSLERDSFCKAVEKIKEYILSGDSYQINLTSQIRFRISGNPRDLFLEFFRRQPVPFAFYLDLDEIFIISGSMELFLQKRGRRLMSMPVKGTGGPGDSVSDSEKERAENLMITDMMRNDIGRVALPGSVKVSELFAVRRFKTLTQMHSTVEGETSHSFSQILEATFPPASVTGAPKVRAVQIIDELEPHSRGYYCGSAGFLKKNGDFTLSVLIRTAFGGGSEINYYAGCGIVWDSDPVREWEELKLKVSAFYQGVWKDL